MTPQDPTSESNDTQPQYIAKPILQETLTKDLDTSTNHKTSSNEEEESKNGFELFMQNTKGNFSKLIGCGG